MSLLAYLAYLLWGRLGSLFKMSLCGSEDAGYCFRLMGVLKEAYTVFRKWLLVLRVWLVMGRLWAGCSGSRVFFEWVFVRFGGVEIVMGFLFD